LDILLSERCWSARRWLAGDRVLTCLMFGSFLIALAIGLRYEVGADWNVYKFLFSYARYADLDRVLRIGDPGYQLLNWAVQHIGAEIWLVNLVCGVIFAYGLFPLRQIAAGPMADHCRRRSLPGCSGFHGLFAPGRRHRHPDGRTCGA
jgi:hypothetical protein